MNPLAATSLHRPTRSLMLLAALGLGAALAQPARADTDIATAPLFTTTTTNVKPNLMFVLDDSGSMGWDYLPDDADFGIPRQNSYGNVQYGRRASQCNGVAYNPSTSVSYDPPLNADGTKMADASTDFLAGADPNGTLNQRSTSQGNVSVVSSGTLNLTISSSNKRTGWYAVGSLVTVFNNGSTSKNYMLGTVTGWNSSTGALTVAVKLAVGSGSLSNVTVGDGSPVLQYYYSYTGSQTAMSYRYPSNSLDTTSTFYKECNSVVGSTPGSSVFTLNIVTKSSSEAQRYANWYTYYRTRMGMMKASVSRAFSVMDSRYRIGFSTISDTGATEGDTFLDVADFDTTQKGKFYTKLMAANPSPSTPLRGALSKAGRYYAKKVSGQTYDPIQYSCQKNFTILSTDGYWNTQDEVSGQGASLNYGPYQFDNVTAVGQQDGLPAKRPQFDGSTSSTATSVTKWTVTTDNQTTTVTPSTRTDKTTTNTTHYTPTQSQQRTNYALTITAFNNSGISRSCTTVNNKQNCTVTVTTSGNHGFASGQSITMSGVTPTTYNVAATITVTGASTFTYTINGLSSAPSTPTSSNYGVSTVTGTSCSAGKGQQRSWTEVLSYGTTSTHQTITSQDTPQSRTVVTGNTTTTNYTRTVIVKNGVQTSDTTTSTTNSTTVQTLSDTGVVATGPAAPTVPAPTPAADTTGTYGSGSWVATTTPVTLSGCVSTASSPTTPTSIAAPADQVSSSSTSSTATGTVSSSTVNTPTTGAKTTTTTSSSSAGGANNTLADVAMFYYQNPLRSDTLGNCTGALNTSICDANQPVVAFGDDTAPWLHMSTYTLSLGNSGTLLYDPNYQTQASGDFADVKNGAKDWPVPSSDAGAVNIDDLWHAAVNGRGRYFSANDPNTLSSSLSATLSTIQAITGSSSAAATSTLQPVQGDNGVYIAQFRSSEWIGDLRAYSIDVNTGVVTTSQIGSDGKPVDQAMWSASDKLTTSYARTIYYFRPSGTSGSYGGSLQPFVYDTTKMTSTERGYVENACSKTPALTQCSGLSGTALDPLNSGANMVSFLRGQAQSQYRTRNSVLGDIVDSSPVYIGKPVMNYTENNYAQFKSDNAGRKATIYVGANDGMLHAFNAETDKDAAGNAIAKADGTSGTERWAYIPNLVMSKLYLLADSYYASKHQYYVDATPAVSDVYDATQRKWRTILVGGLNAGGRGYYALDVTDPTTPIALWEYSNADKLGYSFGNPVITKRKDGTWIVAFTSGYNNTDGGGYLFALNALTGAPVIDPIGTGVGSAGSSSGLGKLNAWIEADTENLAKRFYAGDLQGNLWRFDIDGNQEPKNAAMKLAQLTDDSGAVQPITTAPQLAQVDANGGSWPVVYVGTGRYLGKSDVSATGTQSIYAIKDSLGSTGVGIARSDAAKLVKQPVTTGSPRVVGSKDNPVNWATKNGWYVDLPSAGERINVDMTIVFDTLVAAANVPGSTATDCTAAGTGKAWLYKINIVTGGGGNSDGTDTGTSSDGVRGSGSEISSMIVGLSPAVLGKNSSGGGNGIVIVNKSDATQQTESVSPPGGSGRTPHRTAWRELAD